jgi:putative NADPH-quinone reductase
MNALIILAHPDPSSFNHAIARTIAETLRGQGHQVCLHDLYAEKFESDLPANEIPRMAILPEEIQRHCSDLANADGLVFVHPNWWGMPPAILKGWIDRVIRPDVAYRFLEGDSGEGVPLGLLKARTALVFNTSNTSVLREQTVFGDPLETLWKNCILKFCGVDTIYRRMFNVIVTSTPDQRSSWLAEVRTTVHTYFPVEIGRD